MFFGDNGFYLNKLEWCFTCNVCFNKNCLLKNCILFETYVFIEMVICVTIDCESDSKQRKG